MGVNIYPAPAGGGIKSVQRGTASAAGTITISAVNVNKTYVNSFGTAAAGSSPILGTSGTSLNLVPNNTQGSSNGGLVLSGAYTPGTTTLSTKVYGVSLTNSTTITATGACRWEVVEMM